MLCYVHSEAMTAAMNSDLPKHALNIVFLSIWGGVGPKMAAGTYENPKELLLF